MDESHRAELNASKAIKCGLCRRRKLIVKAAGSLWLICQLCDRSV